MTGFQNLIQQDRALFIFLNGLGNEHWDSFWLLITNQFVWIPLYLFFLILLYKYYGQKRFLYCLIFIILLVTFSDQISNFVKNIVERTRPNNSDLKEFIRIILHPTGYGFYSAHASTSMAVTTFLYLTLKNHYPYAFLFFVWPILFAYSRIYVGVHYPSDIVAGLTIGFVLGFFFYKIGFYFLKPETRQ